MLQYCSRVLIIYIRSTCRGGIGGTGGSIQQIIEIQAVFCGIVLRLQRVLPRNLHPLLLIHVGKHRRQGLVPLTVLAKTHLPAAADGSGVACQRWRRAGKQRRAAGLQRWVLRWGHLFFLVRENVVIQDKGGVKG